MRHGDYDEDALEEQQEVVGEGTGIKDALPCIDLSDDLPAGIAQRRRATRGRAPSDVGEGASGEQVPVSGRAHPRIVGALAGSRWCRSDLTQGASALVWI